MWRETIVEENLAKKVEAALSESMNALIPRLVEDIKTQTKEVFNVTMKEALSKLKEDLTSGVKNEISHCEKKVNLTIISEAELLETYNCRDNVQNLGLSETLHSGEQSETMETTRKKVVDVSNALEAQISENDISIAHIAAISK